MAAPPVPQSSESFLADGAQTRLDLFLVEKTGRSRMFLKEQIEAGHVAVNGSNVSKGSAKIRPGDTVSVAFVVEAPSDLTPVAGDLEILFEDEYLLALNKRQGDVVHPATGHRGPTIVHYLLHHLKDVSTFHAAETDRPGIVHRLDKGTSGVLLVGKSRQIQESLSRLFQNREVKKEYEAVVWGKPGDRGKWQSIIGRDDRDRKKMSTHTSKGRDALTHWTRTKAFLHFAHLALFPHTGRTHQIRVHCTEAGFPVVGDPIYGRGRNPARIRGLDSTVAEASAAFTETLLHARRLQFVHPVTNEAMAFEAKRPSAFTDFLALLEISDK